MPDPKQPNQPLTKREEEVLLYTIRGYKPWEIRELTGIPHATVSSCKTRVKEKYEVDELIELANIQMHCPECGTVLERTKNETT